MTRTAKTAVGLWAAALMVFGVLTWAPFPAGAQAAGCSVSALDQAIDTEEQALLGLINQYRQAYGKNALGMHSDVTRAAAWFSRDMASKDYFPYNHIDSNGRGIDQRLIWCGVSFSNWAENVYAGSASAQAVFDAWRASSTHNTNMLRDGVTSAGIARAYQADSTYSWYWTLDVTNSAGATTSTSPPVTTPTSTTTAPPTTAPAPGTREWYAQSYPQFFGTTTTTSPPPPVITTTTTTQPPATTTTTVPATGPVAGTAEWYWQWFSQYYAR